jgi:hypothetical protein
VSTLPAATPPAGQHRNHRCEFCRSEKDPKSLLAVKIPGSTRPRPQVALRATRRSPAKETQSTTMEYRCTASKALLHLLLPSQSWTLKPSDGGATAESIQGPKSSLVVRGFVELWHEDLTSSVELRLIGQSKQENTSAEP